MKYGGRRDKEIKVHFNHEKYVDGDEVGAVRICEIFVTKFFFFNKITYITLMQ